MNISSVYFKQFGAFPEDEVFCPYRICPLGAHVDHQHGHINGMAIDKGIYFAFSSAENGACELYSVQFAGKAARFNTSEVPAVKTGDWADYLRGAVLQLLKKQPELRGVKGVFAGELPIGGLSSSAAVTLAFLAAMCRVNNIKLSDMEMIMTAKLSENEYVGVNCGKLDQACEVLCRKGKLLYLDTDNDEYELIKPAKNMPEYRIAVFFSGLEHALSNSKYNARQDECKAAAYALKAFADIDYDKFSGSYLRDVSREVYEKYGTFLPENWRKRAEHFYTEDERAVKGSELWKNGDIASYGELMNKSGYSSIHAYEAGSPELKKLYEIMLHTDGIYGGRFSGAGFKGCCIALIDPRFETSIAEKVGKEYKAAFPALSEKYAFYSCDCADGILM